ncbi:sodium:alanine symporter family protein [Saccharobesus litoralis]|uniref:Sodium:alanine symporter family protein n=1 Tax=Saccharobesus litoralis TaxID=2172099 RepID=A0A2S0VTZ6_9ALTE|nr:AGCS family amino acid carrier protein [Saccharobesus litoralis]AWB67687.1 sodium:alanine symporter family protein [Saccharobesus litoralis]
MTVLNDFLLLLDSFLGSAIWFPYLLLGVGLFFTLYLGFPQLRYFKRAWQILLGKHDHSRCEGDTSHFQALSTALSGTVGTGNIGGVAFAIFLGGPAALFWMWVTAFLGMTTKFVEVTLSHKYRVKTEDGTMAGGPMYFMERKLNAKWLAIIFALATVLSSFGAGNMPQINNIASGMQSSFGIEPWLSGAVLSILLGLVIIGGISRIAAVTSKIVPFMAAIYIFGALTVIGFNIDNIGPAFVSIFSDAFTGSAAAGGFLGASFAYAFSRGVNRGLFSNEAGQGSAAIAHASAKADEPVSEGMVSILEPFIDTIILCTLTGLVILSSGVWTEKFENTFPRSEMVILQGQFSDQNEQDRQQLYQYLVEGKQDVVQPFTGELIVKEGRLVDNRVTIINARSVAESVKFEHEGKHSFSGLLQVQNGKIVDKSIKVIGKSLIHSTQLTAKAFTRGFMGQYGEYVVTIGILLFAFSTAISWSYYGDRAMTYLFGARSVMPYRVIYVAGFMWAAVADTSVIWNIAAVAIVLMTLPNLVGIVLLHKDMKQSVKQYWQQKK